MNYFDPYANHMSIVLNHIASEPTRRGSAAHPPQCVLPFVRRALSILEDAMSKGHVLSTKGVEEGPFTVDLRAMPPTLSEVLVLSVLSAFERRAAKTGG